MILLTGGTGFVGRALLPELLKGGSLVRLLARDQARASGLVGDGVEFVKGDVTDKASVEAAFDFGGGKITSVIHLVGILTETGKATVERVHVEGTRNIVEATKRFGAKRYLHVSALGTRAGARSAYHRTKWAAEEIVRSSGLAYTIFRPSVMFGPGDKFTNVFAGAMRITPVIAVPGDGKGLMQPVYVGDVARFMAFCLKRVETENKIYEVGGPERLTLDAIIDAIAGVLGKKVVKAHVPLALMRPIAMLSEKFLPTPPITRDQLIMLGEDNVTAERALEEVAGIKPTTLAEGMKGYLR
jgi:NADH dehydrogenase